ncbi:hypothetical protein EGM88_12230 [Aureibaculum marinum]|uniref:Sugar transporter n=1 Tax=Aureibaculum marinum TaxID=2487930 RepID=A0A3N4NEA3_9FLAO|nr:hypothetical protein [Aureibaculum marinum]RPD94501.1 hypothetical protein EGM88_12230 [Aureibaculum marinum]
MTKSTTNRPPIWFWIISVIALIWNGMGVYQYLQQAYKTESFKSLYNQEQLVMIENTPSWVIAAFAIAVFGGLLGAIALLLRKKWAKPIFLLSLIGIIFQMTYNFFVTNAIEVYGPGAIIMPIMILTGGIILLWFSKKGIAKKWLT